MTPPEHCPWMHSKWLTKQSIQKTCSGKKPLNPMKCPSLSLPLVSSKHTELVSPLLSFGLSSFASLSISLSSPSLFTPLLQAQHFAYAMICFWLTWPYAIVTHRGYWTKILNLYTEWWILPFTFILCPLLFCPFHSVLHLYLFLLSLCPSHCQLPSASRSSPPLQAIQNPKM